MFIREKKTQNRKTGAVYVKHILVESERDGDCVRQRTIMGLGKLDVDRREWKKLAHALECELTGQHCLLTEEDKELQVLAKRIVSNAQFTKSIQNRVSVEEKNKRRLLTIDLADIQTTQTRSLGAELVGQWAWEQLNMSKILKQCGLSEREISVARALIIGRLVEPGSEWQTFEWFKTRTALGELPGSDISGLGKDLFYTVGSQLYDNKDRLESLLYESGRKLYPHDDATIFLYDLTNTYMEGACLENDLAHRGHCKSKRYDCPLITLALIVDGEGMPITCHIYKGNQSEPETLPQIVERLETTVWDNQIQLIKPTFAMDRGIATEDNVTFLRERGYPYVIIRREDDNEEYKRIFQNERDSFESVGAGHKSVYGDVCDVYVHKASALENGIAKVLCISDGKAHKEEAIDKLKENRFLALVQKLDNAIKRETIKKEEKISGRLDTLLKNNKNIAEHFDCSLQKDESIGKITGVFICKKQEDKQKLYGCYVIETTQAELSGTEIWKLYMTLSHVENAFRMMKGELGVRPVFHQKAERVAAHLFISILAYHLLAVIERRLRENGIHKQWSGIRKTLSTFVRSTVMMRDEEGNTHYMRVSSRPESSHAAVFECLGIHEYLPPVHTALHTLCSG